MTFDKIAELIARVDAGERRTFAATAEKVGEDRFLKVYQSWDYRPGRLTWHNHPEIASDQMPRRKTRFNPANPLSSMSVPRVTFDGRAKDVVEYYGTSFELIFISPAFMQLIDSLDPEAFERVPIVLAAKDAELPYYAAYPSRTLNAIDTERSDVEVHQRRYTEDFVMPEVSFPNGCILSQDIPADVHVFIEMDYTPVLWSRALIERAGDEGMRGFYAKSIQTSRRKEVYRF